MTLSRRFSICHRSAERSLTTPVSPQRGTVSLTCSEQKRARRRMRAHAAATASCNRFAASARNFRSVERETRWRWRLKVLWTAACMLRKLGAERADLNRCILRFSPPHRLMRVFGSIVLPHPLLMRASQSQTPERAGVEQLWSEALLLE